MQFFLCFFFPPPLQDGEQNSDMTVVAFYDLLITIMCQAMYHMLGIQRQMRELAPVLLELVFNDCPDQLEFLPAKNTTVLPS